LTFWETCGLSRQQPASAFCHRHWHFVATSPFSLNFLPFPFLPSSPLVCWLSFLFTCPHEIRFFFVILPPRVATALNFMSSVEDKNDLQSLLERLTKALATWWKIDRAVCVKYHAFTVHSDPTRPDKPIVLPRPLRFDIICLD
jgi:hypothetical protein